MVVLAGDILSSTGELRSETNGEQPKSLIKFLQNNENR